MLKTRAKKTKRATTSGGFVRVTVTLPGDVMSFAETEASRPEYAGNFSAMVRNLILEARTRKAA